MINLPSTIGLGSCVLMGSSSVRCFSRLALALLIALLFISCESSDEVSEAPSKPEGIVSG